jgi:hypothetical protein
MRQPAPSSVRHLTVELKGLASRACTPEPSKVSQLQFELPEDSTYAAGAAVPMTPIARQTFSHGRTKFPVSENSLELASL